MEVVLLNFINEFYFDDFKKSIENYTTDDALGMFLARIFHVNQFAISYTQFFRGGDQVSFKNSSSQFHMIIEKHKIKRKSVKIFSSHEPLIDRSPWFSNQQNSFA